MNPAQDSQIKFSNKKFTLNEAAGILGVSHTSLRRYETAGKIKAERLENGHRLFKNTEVMKFKKQLEFERKEYKKHLNELVDKSRNEGVKIKISPRVLSSIRKIKTLPMVVTTAFLGIVVFTFIASGVIQNKNLNAGIKNAQNYVGLADNWIRASLGVAKIKVVHDKELLNVLSAADRNANFLFNINSEAFFKDNVKSGGKHRHI